MEKDDIIFNYPGESKISRFIGVIALIIIVFLSLSSIFKLNLLGLSVGLGLLFILFVYIHNKVILNVIFHNEYIVVKYIFKTKEIPIKSIVKLYENQEGFIPTHVYVIMYKIDDNVKKITFYCEVNEFKNIVSPWFQEKGIVTRKKYE